MSIVPAPVRICDRPGCSARVTKNGGVAVSITAEDGATEGATIVLDNGADHHAPDLCRSCLESLHTWWLGKDARASRLAKRAQEPDRPDLNDDDTESP